MDARPEETEPEQPDTKPDEDPKASAFEVAVDEERSAKDGRTLKQGHSFAVLSEAGTLRAGTADGLYHDDMRHLSRLEVGLGGCRPMLLSSTIREDNTELVCDLTNPAMEEDGGPRADTVHIRREQFLWDATFHECLSVRNYGPDPLEVELRLAFDADFADIFQVRGTKRDQRGNLAAPQVADARVTFAYAGLDGLKRRTILSFSRAPDALDGGAARFSLSLEPGQSCPIHLAVRFEVDDSDGDARRDRKAAAFDDALEAARNAMADAAGEAAAIVSSNDIFNELARRSVADLTMLCAKTEHGRYPFAGVPWFSTQFGRDGLITAFQTLWIDPGMARGVLGYLAATQADEYDPDADAEPGKILHETRRSEMAMTGEVPFRRYYGSVDSTPLFVMLAGAYLERTGDADFVASLSDNIERALSWMEKDGARGEDGFLWYGRKRDTGLSNQGWKDSWDSVFHADGRLAKAPIALVEVQGYAYGAWMAAAAVFEASGKTDRAGECRAKADRLAKVFDETFWDEELGTYVLALDGAGEKCRVRSSNVGHALWTGIVRRDRAEQVVRALMDERSFSGWGVRTVPVGEARYNPMSYHDGSVWPHDNAIVGMGLARYGYRKEAARILRAMVEASQHVELRRLPELFCGFPRREGRGPTAYPVACSPQAWAAGAPLALLGACLGLRFDGTTERVELCDPVLPDIMDRLRLRRVAVGEGRLDILLRRVGDGVSVSARKVKGGASLTVRYG